MSQLSHDKKVYRLKVPVYRLMLGTVMLTVYMEELVEATNVIIDHQCNNDHNCNSV